MIGYSIWLLSFHQILFSVLSTNDLLTPCWLPSYSLNNVRSVNNNSNKTEEAHASRNDNSALPPLVKSSQLPVEEVDIVHEPASYSLPRPQIVDTANASDGVVSSPSKLPQTILIDSIGLDAPIISAGKTNSGNMIVPDDASTVGWWKYGKKPGDLGTAVLAGHYTIADGSPGVFFRLREVKKGSLIRIISQDRSEKTFRVELVKVYALHDFPLEAVFKSRDGRKLNLITCEGDYLVETDNFSHRRVLFAQAID